MNIRLELIVFMAFLATGPAAGQLLLTNGQNLDMTDSTGSQIIFPDGTTLETAPSAIDIPSGHGGTNNTVTGQDAFVGGGLDNTANGDQSTVGGGATNVASDIGTVIDGGANNSAGGIYSTIGGGRHNTTSGTRATIAGGYHNLVTDNFCTVAGGYNNQAGDNDGNGFSAQHASVGGGFGNFATAVYTTVSGGVDNVADGQTSTIGGGDGNVAVGILSTIAGGSDNSASQSSATVGGGYQNIASGTFSVVVGGFSNEASGTRATAVGGGNNVAAGDYSLAGGRRAKIDVTHHGAFLWADQLDTDFNSIQANEFAVRATGGVRFVTDSDPADIGVKLDPGDTAWETLSARDSKEHLVSVDPQEVLGALLEMPLFEWNYKHQDRSIRHIGPTAEDFHRAFNLNGAFDGTISTIDVDGVALAAIQGLHHRLHSREAEIEQLKRDNQSLARRLAELEKRFGDTD